ncbi:MAG: hypothetical protein ACREV4_16580 [Gammaproteobacteria bacterium]
MEGLTRPPRIALGADDLHNNAGTHTNEHRHPQYTVVGSAVPTCRECGAPTTLKCGNRCPACWRWELTERRLERITRMIGVGDERARGGTGRGRTAHHGRPHRPSGRPVR